MKRALTLGLVLLATAASATDLSPSREALGQKTQWAPSGNFSALHGRAVFRVEIRSDSHPYARARGEVASGIGIFLSRDAYEGALRSAPSLHRFTYAQKIPFYTDDASNLSSEDKEARQTAAEKRAEERAKQKEGYRADKLNRAKEILSRESVDAPSTDPGPNEGLA
ncbi:MAG: hypothetical protein Q8K32_36460 [Archangium sp.]|nr:hypothetical protein [Archangium sp.]